MKKIKYLISLLLLLGLVACSGNKIEIDFNSSAKDLISSEYLNNNKVGNTFYPTEDGLDHYYDTTSPKERIIIISDEELFKEIFVNYECEIDFNEKIVILYIFADVSPRIYKEKKVSIEEKVLTIEYKDKKRSNLADDSMPYQRCFMVVIDNVELENVIFKKVKWNDEKG